MNLNRLFNQSPYVDLDFKVCTAANPSTSHLAFFGISLVVEFDCSMRQFRGETLTDCRNSPSGVAIDRGTDVMGYWNASSRLRALEMTMSNA